MNLCPMIVMSSCLIIKTGFCIMNNLPPKNSFVFFSRFKLSWLCLACVVDLFACWWTAGAGSTRSATVWKIVLSCLLRCL